MLTLTRKNHESLKNIFQRIYKYFFISLLSLSLLNAANAANIISDDEVESTIKQLAAPIIKAAGMQPNEINFYVILDQEINAFVYGGRNIFINTGLITLFNDPDVLKGVIAHELGHISGGHIARREEQLKQLMPQYIATTLLGVAAVVAGAGDAGGAIIAGSGHTLERSILRNSRENESSADQAGLRSLHGSHNSSKGLLKLLNYFQNSKRGMGEIDPYAITHPVDSQRIAAVKSSEAQYHDNYESSPEEKKKYSLIVAKLRGFIEPPDEIIRKNDKDLDPTARKYELAIALFRKAKISAAINKMDELIASFPSNPYFYELKGQILFESGSVSSAVNSYRKASELLPSASLIKVEYAIAIINNKNENQKSALNEAISILQSATYKQPASPWIYRNLGIAYGKLGNLAQSNIMLAQSAILQNNYSEAKKFIYNAKRYAKNDPKTLSKIEDMEQGIS